MVLVPAFVFRVLVIQEGVYPCEEIFRAGNERGVGAVGKGGELGLGNQGSQCFGSGERQRFPPPRLLRPLYDARIGVETMATAAACRTFNILSGEGRRVVAALIVAT